IPMRVQPFTNQPLRFENCWKLGPISGSVLAAFAMLVFAMFAAPAAAQTCNDPALVDMRICSDREASRLSGQSGWTSCKGLCLIIPDADGVSVRDQNGQIFARFDGSRFLAGAGITRSLNLLPFVTADGHLMLVDPDNVQSARQLSLSAVV